MATQLFLLNSLADTHIGTNAANLRGTGIGWNPFALSLSRGDGVNAISQATIAGPTNGVEAGSNGTSPTNAYNWLSPPLAADVTISGAVTGNLWASESNMSANVAINFVVDKIDGATGAITEIVRSSRTVEVAVTTRDANNFTATPGAGVACKRGDRIRVRVFGDDSTANMGSGFTFALGYDAASAGVDGDSYVTFTETFSFEEGPGPHVGVSISDGAASLGATATSASVAQSFIPAAAGDVESFKIQLGAKIGSPTGLDWSIRADSSGSPSASSLASGTIGTGLPDGIHTVRLDPGELTLSTATTYWLVLTYTGTIDGTNFYTWRRDGTESYTDGVAKNNPSAWQLISPAGDLCFAVVTAGSVMYLTDTASDVSTASVDREAWTSRGSGSVDDVTNTAAGWTAPLQLTDTAGGTVVDWFTKQLNAFTLGGMCVFNIRALESSLAANASLKAEVAVVDSDGTNPVVVGVACIAPLALSTPGELTASDAAYTANVGVDDTAVSNGQRLRLRLYVDDMASDPLATGHTVTVSYSGTSANANGDTYVTLPQMVTEFVTAAPIPRYAYVDHSNPGIF